MSKYTVEVQIEIPLDSRVKYEIEESNGERKLKVDRVLHNFPYWFNYGEIPHSLGGDGDPLDVVVLCRERLTPQCHIECKLIGVLRTTDNKGIDDKLICVPTDEIDPESKAYNNIYDLSDGKKERIKYFFEHYKETEKSKSGEKKFVKVDGFGNKDEALAIYNKGMDDGAVKKNELIVVEVSDTIKDFLLSNGYVLNNETKVYEQKKE